MKVICEYIKDLKFKFDEVMKILIVGVGLLKWVFVMINYNKVVRMVNLKRVVVVNAEKMLKIKECELVEMKFELKSL